MNSQDESLLRENVRKGTIYWKESLLMQNLPMTWEENKSAYSEVLGYVGFTQLFCIEEESGQIKAGL